MARICIITALYPPHVGGVESYTQAMARQLTGRGHEVWVITIRAEGDLPEEQACEEGTVFRLPGQLFFRGRAPIAWPGRARRRMEKALIAAKPDLCIVQTQLYPHSLWGCKLGKRAGAKTLVIAHGTGHMGFPSRFMTRLAALYEHALTRLICRRPIAIYGVAEACRRHIEHMGAPYAGTLGSAVEYGRIDRILQEPRVDFRGQCGIGPEDFVVTYAGRLVEGKGIPLLLEAIGRLLKAGRHIHCLIAGAGPLRSDCERHVGPNIHLLGQLSPEGVISALAQSDVCCQPSEGSEGLPMVLLEAAICQCALVAVDRGEIGQLIAGDAYGILLKDCTAPAISAALEALMRERPRCRAMARAVSERCRENFGWDGVIDRLEALLPAGQVS